MIVCTYFKYVQTMKMEKRTKEIERAAIEVLKSTGADVLEAALVAKEALNAGVRKVHFIDGRLPHTILLEIFTPEGIGTEIVREQR